MNAYRRFALMLEEIKRPTPELLAAWLRARPIRGASEVFSADAQSLAADLPITTNTFTNIISTNPLRTPYLNGKAIVRGWLFIAIGAGTTSYELALSRNVAGENVVVSAPGGITVAASTTILASIFGIDRVPDGRDCSYTLQFQSTGATGNHTAKLGSVCEALMISG